MREHLTATNEVVFAKEPICLPSCAVRNPLVSSITPLSFTADPAEDTEMVLSYDDDTAARNSTAGLRSAPAKVRLPRHAVTGAVTGGAPTFAVRQIPTSDLRTGAYAALEQQSVGLEISVDGVITVDSKNTGAGIELDLCIADGRAQIDASFCSTVLQRLRPFSSSAFASAEEVTGGCVKGSACGCSCLFVAKHLSGFMVVDPGIEVAREDSLALRVVQQRIIEQPRPTPLPTERNDGEAGPAFAPERDDTADDTLAFKLAVGAGMVVLLVVFILFRRRVNAAKSVKRRGFGHDPKMPMEEQIESGLQRKRAASGGFEAPDTAATNPMQKPAVAAKRGSRRSLPGSRKSLTAFNSSHILNEARGREAATDKGPQTTTNPIGSELHSAPETATV
jgi:hypothetical protein